MLLLRRLNNYSSAEFSLTLKRFTFKTAECTIKYMPVKTEWLALLRRRLSVYVWLLQQRRRKENNVSSNPMEQSTVSCDVYGKNNWSVIN